MNEQGLLENCSSESKSTGEKCSGYHVDVNLYQCFIDIGRTVSFSCLVQQKCAIAKMKSIIAPFVAFVSLVGNQLL